MSHQSMNKRIRFQKPLALLTTIITGLALPSELHAETTKNINKKKALQKEGPHSPFALTRTWGTSNFTALHEEWNPFQGIVAGYLWKDSSKDDAKVYVDVNMQQWPGQHGACTFRITGDKVDTLRARAQLPTLTKNTNTSNVIVSLEGDVNFEKEVGWPPLETVEGLGERGGVLYTLNCKKIVRIQPTTAKNSFNDLDQLHHEIRLNRKIKVKVKGFLWRHHKTGTLCVDTLSGGMYSFTYRLKGKIAENLLKKSPSIPLMNPELSKDVGGGGECATYSSGVVIEVEGLAELKEVLKRFQKKQPLKKSGGYLYDLHVTKVHHMNEVNPANPTAAIPMLRSRGNYISYGIKFPYKSEKIKSYHHFETIIPESAKISDLGATPVTAQDIIKDKKTLQNRVQKALIVSYKKVQHKFLEEDQLLLDHIRLVPHLLRTGPHQNIIEDGGIKKEIWQDWRKIQNASKRPYWQIEYSSRKERYTVFIDAETTKVAYASFYHSKK